MPRGGNPLGPDLPGSPQSLRRAARIERIRAMQRQGMSNPDMAEALNISLRSLENFITRWRVQRERRP